MIRQKEVYLVDFAKKYHSKFGKIRPAVIMQNNFINRTLESKKYRSVMVVPLSSTTINDDFRVVISARDKLKEDSECVANWICTLDISRVQVDKGILTTLSDSEFEELKAKVCLVM
ncbi:MAG: type II toxin-antitoxin system PemK/MazF family toxin [Campylobacterales bacterium]|nr:type II toxin-antitoxin system PemK/MazF family toxin [Campylobacterales bacterium]